MIAERNVRMAMRDGTQLSADVYRPDWATSGPVVLTRTCYTKIQSTPGGHAEKAAFWTAHGYIYVVQDVRGRGDSEGSFYPLVHELEDGSDTLDWIASQPWSDGRVVMVGGSYRGWTQVYAAASGNHHLKALVPVTTPPDPDRLFPLSRGMILPAAASWMAAMDGHIVQDLNDQDVRRAFEHRPIAECDRAFGRRLSPWREWVRSAVRGEYWDKQAYQDRLMETHQPMLHVTGWYDDCLTGALENFAALSKRKFAGQASAQRLLVGPWNHLTIGQRKVGDIDYGPAAQINLDQLQHEWFHACLNGQAVHSAPVQLFVMGRNAWLTEEQWPVARTQYVHLYLHSGGRANTRNGDGSLSMSVPQAETPDHFRHNPDDPVHYTETLTWAQVGGADDSSRVELREDVLVYTCPEITQSLLICGHMHLRLFAASSARDTDWMVKVVDVHPDGRAIRLNDGAVRARFRRGHHGEEFVPPGTVEKYEIDCGATCIELAPGHRLRIEIASSAFGKYDVNLGGGGPVGRETEAVIAEQTIYHDAAHPSHLLLPVLPRTQSRSDRLCSPSPKPV
jgi:uncharacterized protein